MHFVLTGLHSDFLLDYVADSRDCIYIMKYHGLGPILHLERNVCELFPNALEEGESQLL